MLARQEEKTEKLLIKTRGTIQGCGGGAEKLVKIPYEKLKHGFKSSQKIVYRKVSKAELRPAQAWASSGSQGVEGLQFQEATPLPPTRAPSVHPGAETIQPERGRWTADSSRPGRQLTWQEGFWLQPLVWNFSFLPGWKPSFRPVDGCTRRCSRPPASGFLPSHTQRLFHFAIRMRLLEHRWNHAAQKLFIVPLPTKEIPIYLAWHSMLFTALPWSAFPESSPASLSYLPPALLQFSPLNHTDLPQATDVLLFLAFVPRCNSSFGLSSKQALFILFKIQRNRDFPGGLVGKTPCSQCKGSRLHPWSGNKTPPASTKNLACCN